MLVSSALFGDMGLYWMSAGLQVTMTEILSDIPQALHDVTTSISPNKPLRPHNQLNNLLGVCSNVNSFVL